MSGNLDNANPIVHSAGKARQNKLTAFLDEDAEAFEAFGSQDDGYSSMEDADSSIQADPAKNAGSDEVKEDIDADEIYGKHGILATWRHEANDFNRLD
ncbi:hypothetical protein EMMF5_003319 [Cystobasidiomycetes sp. EMM_F5]